MKHDFKGNLKSGTKIWVSKWINRLIRVGLPWIELKKSQLNSTHFLVR